MKVLGKPESSSDVVNKEPKVLLIGHGWVGQYVNKYFKTADIFTSGGWVEKKYDHYDMAVIGVPTPMDEETGECDVSIVEEAVKNHQNYVDHFLIKSTVSIGTTDRLAKEYLVSIAMSPEYVGETLGHPLLEARRDAFLILGGKEETVRALADIWRVVLHANAPIFQCTAVEAEIIKYSENHFLMRLVDYWNDTRRVCEAFGANYDRVREGLVLDPRVQRTHSFVYPNNRGWSGKCLPKDMNALAYSMRKAGSVLETLEHMIEKNVRVRKDYDNKEKLIPNKPKWENNTPEIGFSGNRGND